MLKTASLYVRAALVIGTLSAIVIVYPRERGFKQKLLDYIDDNAASENIRLRIPESPDYSFLEDTYDTFGYRSGDWDAYIIEPRYKDLDPDRHVPLYESDDIRINTYGALNLDLLYGKSMYTRKRYQQYDLDKPLSLAIKDGFMPKQDLQLHVEGTIGDRMTVYIDHDSRKKDNRYLFRYRGLREDELIRELNAGEIDINFQGSKYAVYDNNTQKGLGVDLTLKKNNFLFKAFGSVTRGQTETEVFRGNSTPGNIKLAEYQYVRGIYYQIEPYIRYGAAMNPPYPPTYALQTVSVNPAGFELWMDDQDPNNNFNSVQLPLDGGFYTKMQSGVDYKINYATGLVTLMRSVPQKARMFAVYTLAGTASTDPSALQPGDPLHPHGQFEGKIFVFIKYGYSIAEAPGNDVNHDGKVNQDVYEVRSFYYIGDRNLLSSNFSLLFYMENGIMTQNDIASLGKYSIDYTGGVIEFVYREPFKSLCLANNTASIIYTENQQANVYDSSRFRIKVDYYREARSFQLGHVNIIPDSVSVKVDGRKLHQSSYTVDYTAGYLVFNNANDPLIGPETVIEIRYEYLPLLAAQYQEFVGGMRTEYAFSRDLKIGGSLMYSRSSGEEKIPQIGSTPTQTIFFEGDAALHLDERRLAQFVNLFSEKKYRTVPVEINAYAEYARSYKNINTFGKALIDNMESIEDVIAVSLNERDWILSSRPPGCTTRGILNYYYYRDLTNPGILKNILYAAPKIDYSLKPGPFNVATGHLIETIISQNSQSSLVLDFGDPAAGPADYVSIVTRDFTKTAMDLSGIQYVEFSYRYEGTGDAALYLDIGKVNEDSDGTGILSTEDINYNGVIDTDPATGFSEDVGFPFNEAGHPATRIGGGANLNLLTRGDGIMNSKDLNGNGVLDTAENIYSFNGQSVPLTVAVPEWRTARIYLDQSALTQQDISLLKEVQSVRIYVRKSGGVAGRVYIDTIKFVSNKWRDARIDASPASSAQLKVTAINNYDDDDYRLESFPMVMRELYTSLYGVKDNQELLLEKETALKLEYAIPPGYGGVSATRRFPKPMDLRNYKSLTAWVNFRSFSPGDRIGIVLGSSDTDYLVYQMNMDAPMMWREMRMRIKGNSNGYIFPSLVAGVPDLKRIIYLKVAVYSSSPPSTGTVWIDDLYVSDPDILEDSAHWYEGEIKITRPLYRTKAGVPVLSDISVKYIQKGHGSKFSTVGMKDNDMAEGYKQLLSSFNILPNWNTRVDYLREESSTDSLNEEVDAIRRGKTEKNSLVVVSDFISDSNAVPSVKISYKYDDYGNSLNERIVNFDVKRSTSRYSHVPVIHYQQNVEKFLGGRLSNELLVNMFFKKDSIKRNTNETDLSTLSVITSLMETEKRQRADAKYNLDYTHKVFYFRPGFQIVSEEVVSFQGKSTANNTEILYNVNGDFHFPYAYNKDCKFVERNKQFFLSAGINDYGYITPGYKIDIQYFENRFRDFDVYTAPLYGYERSKDARTLVSSSLNIPIYFNKEKKLKFIRAFTILYSRSIYFTEMNVPYEGEHRDSLDERYGIRRTVGGLSNACFNVFRYYPFSFFTGRNNYAKARDFVAGTYNNPIVYRNGQQAMDYTNSLRLLENFAVNCSLDFNKVTATSNATLNQVCERQNLFGIPGQTITANFDINLNFDLMKLFHTWIFRPNRDGLPYHAGFVTMGYKFGTNMYITGNIVEEVHSPEIGLNFKRDRMSLTLKFGVDIKKKITRAFISLNPFKRSFRDQIYIDNMPQYVFYREKDMGYMFSLLYETDVLWLYKFFALFYRLTAYPIFNLEYTMKINRYEYTFMIRPEPYDLHLISMKLAMDLHKNLQGGLNTRFAVEQFRNRYTGNISKEIFSFEIGGNFTLLF